MATSGRQVQRNSAFGILGFHVRTGIDQSERNIQGTTVRRHMQRCCAKVFAVAACFYGSSIDVCSSRDEFLDRLRQAAVFSPMHQRRDQMQRRAPAGICHAHVQATVDQKVEHALIPLRAHGPATGPARVLSGVSGVLESRCEDGLQQVRLHRNAGVDEQSRQPGPSSACTAKPSAPPAASMSAPTSTSAWTPYPTPQPAKPATRTLCNIRRWPMRPIAASSARRSRLVRHEALAAWIFLIEACRSVGNELRRLEQALCGMVAQIYLEP